MNQGLPTVPSGATVWVKWPKRWKSVSVVCAGVAEVISWEGRRLSTTRATGGKGAGLTSTTACGKKASKSAGVSRFSNSSTISRDRRQTDRRGFFAPLKTRLQNSSNGLAITDPPRAKEKHPWIRCAPQGVRRNNLEVANANNTSPWLEYKTSGERLLWPHS